MSTILWLQLGMLILTALLTVTGFRKALERDRESIWRKAKLDLYSEFINDFAKLLANMNSEKKKNFIPLSMNKIMIFAPEKIVEMCYQIVDNIMENKDDVALMEQLIRDIRADIIPGKVFSHGTKVFTPRFVYPAPAGQDNELTE
jgi:predicted LPLAT superfamily acyltransferase